MADAILVLNAGSSSLKFSVFLDGEPPEPLLRGQLEGLVHPAALPGPRRRRQRGRGAGVAGRHQARPRGGDRVPVRLGPRRRARRAPHRRGGPPRRARGPEVHPAGARRSRRADGAGGVRPAGAAAPAAQPGRDPGGCSSAAPDLPQVACFDTSFHRTQPAVAQAFALPRRYTEEGVLPLRLPRPVLRVHRLGAARPRRRARRPAGPSWPTWATAPACVP